MTKDSYGYPTKIPTKITDLYGGDDIPTSDDIVEEIEEYLDIDIAREGQVLTMGTDGIIEWDDVASGGGLDYSAEEQDTGIKWIDGKEIYQITKSFILNSDRDILTDVDTMINCEVLAPKTTNGSYCSLSTYIPQGTGGYSFTFNPNTHKVNATTYSNYNSGSNVYVTVRFTKRGT